MDPRFRDNAQRLSRAITEEAQTSDVAAELEAVVTTNGSADASLELR